LSDAADNECTEDLELKVIGPVANEAASGDADVVGEAIGREAMVMIKGIVVPQDGKLTESDKGRIRQLVTSHRENFGISLKDIALQLNIGPSTLGEVLRGVYCRAPDTPLLLRLNSWLETDARRKLVARPNGFYSTAIFKAIQGLATFVKSKARTGDSETSESLVRESARIAIGWGPAGCGKSTGAAALHHADETSILARIGQKQGTDTALARLIIAAGGWRRASQSTRLIDFVIERLTNTGRLLIVDEGHRLRFSGCELLRDLADECGIPILILATSEFYERATSVRTKSGSLTYDQFSRRVGMAGDLIRGLDGKGGTSRPIFSAEEIAAIFKTPSIRISPDGNEYLQAVACTIGIGMLGEAVNIFELAVRTHAKVIDERILRQATKKVLVPAGSADFGVLTQVELTMKSNRALPATQPKVAAYA
jgi:hypothetical protein